MISRRVLFTLLAVAGAIALAGIGWAAFGPAPEEHRAEAAPEGALLRSGSFRDGEPLHHAQGSVQLLRLPSGAFSLRFSGYDATPGPDVFFYLTPAARASTTAEVEGEGFLLRTNAASGQATLRGDFNVEIPADVGVSAFSGIVAWCRSYNVLFGYAELVAA